MLFRSDLIFGALAMVTYDEKEPYLPDYTLSVEQVYTRFSAQIMNNEGHLALLSDTARWDRSRSLPSWVPDFHSQYTSYYTLQSHHEIYSAGGSKSPVYSFSEDELILTLRGKILDVIKTVLNDVPKQGEELITSEGCHLVIC